MLGRPLHDLDEGFPERLVFHFWLRRIRAGDDESVQAGGAHVVERFVVAIEILARLRAARARIDGERMHVDLRDPVAGSDEAHELPLGRLERRVRHHVEQPDVQLPDVLMPRALERQYLLPGRAQPLEAREIGVGDEWHREAQATALASTSMARAVRSMKSRSSRTVSASAAVTV